MVILKGTINISNEFVITTRTRINETTDSLGSTLFNYMQKHKMKIAQIDSKTNHSETFEELLQRCIRTAIHMKFKNVRRNDIISSCSKNHLNSCVPYIATQFLGAKFASIDTSFSPQETSHLLKQVRPKMIFVTPESVEKIRKCLHDVGLESTEIVVFGESREHVPFEMFLEPCKEENDFRPVRIENLVDTAVIYFSSGTTGLPKGICLSHYAIVSQSMNSLVTENPDYEYMQAQASRVSFPLIQLGYTSLYWVSAGAMLISSIIGGHCRLICSDFDPEEIWYFIQKYKPVALVLTPVQVISMLERKRNVEVNSVLSVMIIGSSISRNVFLKMQLAFPEADVTRSYGMTETCGILTTFRGNDRLHRALMAHQEKTESVGLPIRGTSYKVVHLESGENLGPNQQGELRIKSKFIMNGFYNDDSSNSFDEDGWLKTGDVVYYDEDFCFYVVDRIREAFKYQGWFITPSVIENELLNHQAVRQAVVLGIPREDGEHPMALVVIKNNFKISEIELEQFIASKLPKRLWLRGGVTFVQSIPMTITGKVKRREIRRMILEEKHEL